jgi:hypothetical protein
MSEGTRRPHWSQLEVEVTVAAYFEMLEASLRGESHEDGRERLVEVKTTKSGEYMPFYVTRNELAVSQAAAAACHLYRVFRFGAEPGLFMVSGSLDQSCRLEPNSYIARSN